MTALLSGPDPQNFWRRWSVKLPGGGRVDFAQPRRIDLSKFPPLEPEPEPPPDDTPPRTRAHYGEYPVSEAAYQKLRETAWRAWFPDDPAKRRAMIHFDGCCAVCAVRLARVRASDADRVFANLLVWNRWFPDRAEGAGNRVPLCQACHTSKGAAEPLQWLAGRYREAGRVIGEAVAEFLLEARHW